MAKVLLASAATLPAADAETPRLVTALAARGIDAGICSWSDQAVHWSNADAVIVRSTWDYTDRLHDFLAWTDSVAATTQLWNPAPVIRWNAHKGYLIELASRGVAIVETSVLAQHASADACDTALELASSTGGALVVKPAVGAGARGAKVGAAGDADLRSHLAALVQRGDVLLQPFVESVSDEGELSVLVLWGEPLLARRKVPSVGDFRVNEHHGGRTEATELTVELVRAAKLATSAVSEPLLYARVDLVRHEGVLRVMELELIEPYLYLDTEEEFDAVARAIEQVVT